ncbi:MAG: dTDP-4-dehydrorhamnose reductase [Longimicrobiales bacterium]|nr:dTDP-4-dehydrorhamnose reductase [Longimicrobiales bacterium]
MKIVVTGAGGLLGSELVGLNGAELDAIAGAGAAADAGELEIVGLSRPELDVTDASEARTVLQELQPDWVIHCAAYTAVDRAEAEPEEAMAVNHGGTVNVTAAAATVGAGLVYISTDYVFDGTKGEPYLPSDPVAPLSVYARTKLAGEEAALAAGGVAVRTGWLYGAGGGNFVDAILRRAAAGEGLRVVDDQRGRPTWARNVARGVVELVGGSPGRAGAGELAGVWHLADGGDATWLELAREAVRRRGLEVEIEGVSTEEWGAAAPRPMDSVLDLSATEARLGRSMMHWKDALETYLASGT